jgi:predicted transcriptional regulator with HTH domain
MQNLSTQGIPPHIQLNQLNDLMMMGIVAVNICPKTGWLIPRITDYGREMSNFLMQNTTTLPPLPNVNANATK